MPDTTPDKKGANHGFRPHELLEAASASCMNMTFRMYAEIHAIPLAGMSVVLCRGTGDRQVFGGDKVPGRIRVAASEA